jgi:Protein of unknown function (DUF2958)
MAHATIVCGQTVKPFTTPAYAYIRVSDKLPTTDAAYAEEDPLLLVRLFNPTGIGTWWLAGYDPSDGRAYGVAELFEREVGDFMMPELVALRGIFRLPIERTLGWEPRRMSDVMKGAR